MIEEEQQQGLQGKRWVFWLALLAVGFCLVAFSCVGAWLFVDSNTPCGTGDSSTIDLWRARSYAMFAFPDSLWKSSYKVSDFRIDVIRLSDELRAVAAQEYLIYNCGYSDEDIDTYYSEKNFSTVILSGYQDVKKVNSCQMEDGARLYQFEGNFEDTPYLLSQWFVPDGEKRGIGFFMAFPASQEAVMQSYAEKLFPGLVACP